VTRLDNGPPHFANSDVSLRLTGSYAANAGGNAPKPRFAALFLLKMNKIPFYSFFALAFFSLAPTPLVPFGSSGVALAQSKAATTFGHIRKLSLEEVRALALERAPAIAQAKAKIEAAQAEEKELKKRIVPQVGGGIDPFSGQVRYYMNLDLQRLLQLNKAERQKARRTVEAEQQGQTQAQNSAIASVTAAWFGLKRAEAGHATARRNLITAKAIFVSADARFRAGTGELGSVLSALNGKASGEDAVISTRQGLLLACLTLAQACGYSTAEEMEAAIGVVTSSARAPRFGLLSDGEMAPDAIEEDKEQEQEEPTRMAQDGESQPGANPTATPEDGPATDDEGDEFTLF
jgi:outer membrane protein TolC